MPRRYDRCVKNVGRKISSGKIPKTYVKKGKRMKSNPYAICSRLRATGKANPLKEFDNFLGEVFQTRR